MIEVRIDELARTAATAILRPITADWGAVTPATRRLELTAGPAVAEQCQRLGELPVGSAAITGAGALPADYLVHVVVRAADQPVTAEVVRRALVNGLRRLDEWGIDSVALPPLGTGAGNLDPEESAAVMIPTLREHLQTTARPLGVTIVVESEYECEVFRRALVEPTDTAPRAG